MKGRKPLPDYIKRMTGNPGKRPLNAAAPALPSERPTPPSCLSPAALAHWHRMIPVLERAGKLTAFTQSPLARYCVACSDYEEIVLLEAGMGRARLKPRKSNWRTLVFWRGTKKDAVRVMRDFELAYGLTPASAARFTSLPPLPPNDGFDAFIANNPQSLRSQLSDLTLVDPTIQGS
jgi:phage terminase small subunit